MNKSSVLAKAIQLLVKDGLLFLSGVPKDPESVGRIAERIGPIRNTFYGRTWDVRSVPNAKNVAYTNQYLGFHMDLLYMNEPPGFQLLHCIENSCSGGESRFADTFKAFDILMRDWESVYDLLGKPVFQHEYSNDGHYYTCTKPFVQTFKSLGSLPRWVNGGESDITRKIRRIHWSPPFLGAVHLKSTELRRVHAALKEFSKILEQPETVVERKMEPGTCVVFDNLRVVHARNSFDVNSGKRWLRGAYVDAQDVWTKAGHERLNSLD